VLGFYGLIQFIFIAVALFIVVLLTFSCKEKKRFNSENSEQFNEEYINLDLDHSSRTSNLRMSSLFSSVKIIPLQITDNSIIGTIDNLQVTDDKLFVLDKINANSLFVFDMKGKFLFKVGNKGLGPGEYSEISDFTIDIVNKFIFLLDNYRQIINVYNLEDGVFQYDINIMNSKYISYNVQYANGTLYADIYNRENNNDKKQYLLRSIDYKTGKTTGFYLDTNSYNKAYNQIDYLGNKVFFSRNNKPVFMQLFINSIMMLFNEDVEPYIVLKSKEFVEAKELAEAIGFSENNNFLSSYFFTKNKFHTLENFIETDHFILIKCYFNNLVQYLYFDKEVKKTTVHNILYDDVLFKDFDIKTNKTRANFLCSTEIGVYACLSNDNLSYLINDFNKKELNLNQSDSKFFSQLNEESNPIILLYEYK